MNSSTTAASRSTNGESRSRDEMIATVGSSVGKNLHNLPDRYSPTSPNIGNRLTLQTSRLATDCVKFMRFNRLTAD